MLTIRAEQVAALSRVQVARFEDWMIEHIKLCWPDEFAKVQEPAMRQTVKDGVKRANGYGFTSERDVCKYIDLMIAFGAQFDELPWARSVLQSSELREPGLRMDTLSQVGLALVSPIE